MAKSIIVTQTQLAQAFTEWERRYREEPERFQSEVGHPGVAAGQHLPGLRRERHPPCQVGRAPRLMSRLPCHLGPGAGDEH